MRACFQVNILFDSYIFLSQGFRQGGYIPLCTVNISSVGSGSWEVDLGRLAGPASLQVSHQTFKILPLKIDWFLWSN